MGINKEQLGIAVTAIMEEMQDVVPESHNIIAGRDEANAHPMSAITGLTEFADNMNKLNIAQKTVNENFSYCLANITDQTAYISVGYIIPFFPTQNNKIVYDSTNKTFTLKEGKTYIVSSGIRLVSFNNYIYYNIYDKTNSRNIGISGVCECNDNINQAMMPANVIITPTTDIEICVRINICQTAMNATVQNTTYLKIEEIGKSINIDPVNYVNTTQGIEDTPVGSTIQMMGKTAPAHYLICDGAIYNITDYPHLAQYFHDQFGSYNVYGGDGINTFAVPDARNQFIRGYHADNVEKLSGEVGIHQDPTLIPHIATRLTPTGAGMIWFHRTQLAGNNSVAPTNVDKLNTSSKTPIYEPIFTGSTVNGTAGWGLANGETDYSVRPTNIAALICIKYEPTYFMRINGLVEETVLWEGNVGTDAVTAVNNSLNLSHPITDYDKIVAYYYTFATNRYLQSKDVDSSDIKKMIDEPNLKYQISLVWGYGSNADFTSILNTSTINKLEITQSQSHITKIVGVKYKSKQGGSGDDTYTDQEITDMMEEIINGHK